MEKLHFDPFPTDNFDIRDTQKRITDFKNIDEIVSFMERMSMELEFEVKSAFLTLVYRKYPKMLRNPPEIKESATISPMLQLSHYDDKMRRIKSSVSIAIKKQYELESDFWKFTKQKKNWEYFFQLHNEFRDFHLDEKLKHFRFNNDRIRNYEDKLNSVEDKLFYLTWVKKEIQIECLDDPIKYDQMKIHYDSQKGSVEVRIDYWKERLNRESLNPTSLTNPENQKTDNDEITILNRELENRNAAILRLKKKILAKELTKEQLMDIIDRTRKKNGKKNYSAIGKELGCTHETAKSRVKEFGLDGY